MDYELAKELKDAGFLQTNHGYGTFIYPTSDKSNSAHNAYLEGDVMYLPTLSELIAACGEDFRSLHRTLLPSPRWHATGVNASSTQIHATFDGNTPQEAVARLYLALKKK